MPSGAPIDIPSEPPTTEFERQVIRALIQLRDGKADR